MPDDMYFTRDERSLRRGHRIASRTETCRPCLLTAYFDPPIAYRGVVLDVNPYGMLVRMMEIVPLGTEVSVQLMRDEAFRDPLAQPLEGIVVRLEEDADGFMDHGIKLVIKNARRESSRPVRIESRKPIRRPQRTRMHTIDFRVGDEGPRRPKR